MMHCPDQGGHPGPDERGRIAKALIEPLIRTHPDFAALVPFGLPDIRIICLGDVPLMAMMRLPTTGSWGRANLHQGAVGAAINFSNGEIFRTLQGPNLLIDHPSTSMPLIGVAIPQWDALVKAARGVLGGARSGICRGRYRDRCHARSAGARMQCLSGA
jgi:hypothetical protein